MYVLKYNGMYCRFRSYSNVDLVERPEQGTLYNRELDAQKRKNNRMAYWIDGREVSGNQFSIFIVTFKSEETEVA